MTQDPSVRRAVFDGVTPHAEMPALREIDPQELARKAGQARIVDVRGEDEYEGELGHIAGSQLMALPSLAARIGELPKDETIVFVCRSGGRSARATAFAMEAGFSDVYNMKGGMLRWNELGLPVERP